MSLTLLLTHSTSEDSSKHKQIVAYQRQLGKKLDMIKYRQIFFSLRIILLYPLAGIFISICHSQQEQLYFQTDFRRLVNIPLILKKDYYLPTKVYVLHSYTSLKKGTNYYVHIPKNFQILRLKWSFNNINQLCIIIFYFK